MTTHLVGKATITRWVRDSYLHPVLPHVFAVGHCAPSVEADLSAALLYAGSGAALSHATATWWSELSDRQPPQIHVSVASRRRSPRGIRVHRRRAVDRVWYKGLPVTPVAQALLDYAGTVPFDRVKTLFEPAA